MGECGNNSDIMKPDQKEKLSNLLRYLDKNNSYYHELFMHSGIDLNHDAQALLKMLPVTTKKDIRDNYSEYLSNSTQKKIVERTSGSTGTPLVCVKTKAERTAAGLNIWKERRAWDSKVCLENYISLHDKSTYRRFGNFFDYDKLNMKNCLGKLLEASPRWVSGPISAFERYARLIEQESLDYKGSTIKYIELQGECAEKKQREYIERVFGCKTINHYGTIESWCIAYECSEGNLHVQEDLIFAEALSSDTEANNSDAGEIVITSLYNRLMPLIRYNLHDLGRVEYLDCGCGKHSQVITLFGGRTSDMIAGKREIPGELFFKRGVYKLINQGFDCIEGFRVEQRELNRFVFYIIKKGIFTEDASRLLLDYVRKGLGDDIIVDFRYVEHLPPLPSGKMKIFQTLVV